jgi:hypothetical protein
MSRTLLLPIVLLLAGCVSGPVKTDRLDSSLDVEKLAHLVLAQSGRCWGSDVTAFKKGIRLAVDRNQPDQTVLTAFRIGWAGPQPAKPFLTVRMAADGAAARLDVSEQDFDCTPFRCVNLDLRSDLRRWLGGDTSCRDLDKILYSMGIGF